MERLALFRAGTLAMVMNLTAAGWSTPVFADTSGIASSSTKSGVTASSQVDSFVLHDELYQLEWDLDSIRISTTGDFQDWSQGVAAALFACRWFARSAIASPRSENEPGEVAKHTVILDDLLGEFDFQLDNNGGRWFSLFSAGARLIGLGDGIGTPCHLVNPHADVRRSGTGPYDYTAEIATEFSSSDTVDRERPGGADENSRVSESGAVNGINVRTDAKFGIQEPGCRPWVTQVILHDVSFWSGATHIRIDGAVDLDASGILSGSINVSLNVERSFVEFVENSGIFDDPVTARVVGAVLESGSGDYELRCEDGRCRVYGIVAPFFPIGDAPQLQRTC
ncbi:MAG: hypothetical protein OXF88_05460 [Rhodobacteraceae bacterium]|nr:hypothetical protein [Paracoccaceae bacterium]MCY4136844.1 hypothetical protein [Paracoccaceae bacterium]